jgi:siroheme synthase
LAVAIVESASLPEQRIVYTTLAELPTLDVSQFSGPALLLVGPQFVERRAAVLDIANVLQRAHG